MIIKKTFLLIIFLNFLNYINCSIIQFNNSIISECVDLTSPCSLSNPNYWINNQLPVNGDDVVIDYSKVNSTINNSTTLNLYFISSNLNIELNSFKLHGSVNLNLNLIIQQSNITIINNEDSNGCFNATLSNLLLEKQSFLIVNGLSIFSNMNLNDTDNTSLVKLNDVSITGSSIISLNQLQLEGILKSNNSNLIINSDLKLNGGQIILYQTSTLNIKGTINEGYEIGDQDILLFNFCTLSIRSGYTFSNLTKSNLDLFNYGIIEIQDNQNETVFENVLLDNLNLVLQNGGNLTLFHSTLSYLQLLTNETILNIETSSTIKQVYNEGNTTVQSGSTLYLLGSMIINNVTTNCSIIDVYGSLSIQDTFYGSKVYIHEPNGTFYTNSPIYAELLNYSNSTLDYSGNITSIFSNASSSLTITKPGLVVTDRLVLKDETLLSLKMVQLNDQYPIIKTYGNCTLNSIVLSIEFQDTDTQVSKGDRVFLFKNFETDSSDPNSPTINNHIDIKSIKFLNYQSPLNGSTNIDFYTSLLYRVTKDQNDGNTSIEFYKPSHAVLITVVILCTVVPIIILTIIGVTIFKKKRNNNNNNSKTDESDPLIQ